MRLLGRLQEVYARSGLRAVLPLRLKLALRRGWARLAFRTGHPVASPFFAKPRLKPGRRPLRLTHALLASDLNPRYLGCWPLVRRAWREIQGVEPILVVVCRDEDVPPGLIDTGDVRVFPPVDGVPTSLQAQCVRLLYPALLDVEDGVVVSDMELMPLSPTYFHRPLELLDERMFVAYRDVVSTKRQMAIAYNVARPETWRSVFGVETEDEVRARLADWLGVTVYDGVRGGAGWYTDQEILFRELRAWPERDERLWVLDDAYTGFRRLDRHVVGDGGLSRRQSSLLRRGRYTDFDSLVPHSEFETVNESVVRLAAGRARMQGR